MMRAILLAMIASLALTGCASTADKSMSNFGQSYNVEVSGLAAPEAETRRTYVLLPGNQGVDSTDLQFREFATYVSRILNRQGFVPAETAEQADLGVVLFYGIGDPKVTQYTYSLPVWGQTGISSVYTSGVVSALSGTATYTGTTTYTPSYGVTGYANQTGSITTYFRYAEIVGYDLKLFRESKRQIQVWKTKITSTGTSDDLRRVFPIMVAAADIYIAKDTRSKLELFLYEESNRVRFVKGLPQENAKEKK